MKSTYWKRENSHSRLPLTLLQWLLSITLIVIHGCKSDGEAVLFQPITSDQSGVAFSNDLVETPEFNILNYLYFYDGGGVSIGDVNNDGLSDIYFTANMASNRLYLNKGNFQFVDITEKAGVSSKSGWTSGSTMADVNGDGWLDIYVTKVNYLTMEGRNQLFVNNGDSTFTERAAEFGLDFKGYSKHGAFFDYDIDGDLDLFLLNHAVHSESTYTVAEDRKKFDDLAGDRLFKNEGNIFTDVSKEAGIYSSPMGYGLAVTVSDLNTDGCPDIYVSNDFHENDYLYVNQCDGTFKEMLEQSIGHTSRASMGSDIADINNDLRPDIMVLDMLPFGEEALKSSSSIELQEVFSIQRRMGYHPQYTRNSLQLNLGQTPEDKLIFAEIAQYSGVHATDWSWAPLLFDIDNNGFKDLAVTNGIYRRPNDYDYLVSVGSDSIQRSLARGVSSEYMSLIEKMPHVKLPNMLFANNEDLTFSPANDKWGLNSETYSSGMAYGDLDNDGDLDLVINNVNASAQVYKNMTRELGGGNFLKVQLEGSGKNTSGIGSKIVAWADGTAQLYEQMLTRGFVSSVEPGIIVGLDTLTSADSLTVVWPDGRSQTLKNVQANQTLILRQDDATRQVDYTRLLKDNTSRTLFTEVEDPFGIDFRHWENDFSDFQRQRLMPYMLSTEGPPMAVGDVNADALPDIYIGGAKYQRGKLFIQQADGSFREGSELVFKQDEGYEDVDATFFDANGDGALDLYVVSGGNDYPRGSADLEDRIYFNNGDGRFTRMYNSLPQTFENGSTVAATDYDGDGDQDLFVGSRSLPHHYGVSPRSYLFENLGGGRFRDVTIQSAPGLDRIGMVTDARWVNVAGDGAEDLVVVGDWMPITIFENKDGKLALMKKNGLTETNGWWNTLHAGDYDGDGDNDLIAGNIGLNTFFQASKENPLVMYLDDFNQDGQIDPIIGYTIDGEEYPVASRDELLIPFEFLRQKYPTYSSYAGSTISEIFEGHLSEAVKKKVHLMGNSYIENLGDGTFAVQSLPAETQLAPIHAVKANDFNGDGNTDLLLGGNFNEVQPAYGGQYDASYGWFLAGNGDGTFEVLHPSQSGFVVKGEVRVIEVIKRNRGELLVLVARNDDTVVIFKSGIPPAVSAKASIKE